MFEFRQRLLKDQKINTNKQNSTAEMRDGMPERKGKEEIKH